MKCMRVLAIFLLLSSPAFARQGGPRDLAGQSDTQEKSQAQLQRSVTQFYFFRLQSEVGLTDDQFLKSRQIIQNFIGMRFRIANTRKTLDERQAQLLSQPNASDADIQRLNEDASRLDADIATWEGRLFQRLQAELGAESQLSERQIAALRSYNRRFFNERLPGLVEQMRAGAPPRGQQRPAARGNQPSKNQSTLPANTLRGDNTQPVQPRQKLAR
jgi:hypothetical protein